MGKAFCGLFKKVFPKGKRTGVATIDCFEAASAQELSEVDVQQSFFLTDFTPWEFRTLEPRNPVSANTDEVEQLPIPASCATDNRSTRSTYKRNSTEPIPSTPKQTEGRRTENEEEDDDSSFGTHNAEALPEDHSSGSTAPVDPEPEGTITFPPSEGMFLPPCFRTKVWPSAGFAQQFCGSPGMC